MKENAYFRFMNEQGKIELTLIRPPFVGDLRSKVYGPPYCRAIRSSIMDEGQHLVFFFQSRKSAEANGLKPCLACGVLSESCGDVHDLQTTGALRQRPGKMKSVSVEKSSRNPVPDRCHCGGLYVGGRCTRCSIRHTVELDAVWNRALEEAALIVQPVSYIEEERECHVIATAIRALKRGKR